MHIGGASLLELSIVVHVYNAAYANRIKSPLWGNWKDLCSWYTCRHNGLGRQRGLVSRKDLKKDGHVTVLDQARLETPPVYG